MQEYFTNPSKVAAICAVQAVLAMVACGVSAAHSYAQLLDKKVTISLEEVRFEIALKEIEAATDVVFFYSIDQLDVNGAVSIEASGLTLRVVLNQLLSPRNINYKVHEKKRTITLKRHSDLTTTPRAGLIDRTNPSAAAFQNVVTGKVTDGITQQPMAGVNIILKGTTVGTTTDPDGNYSVQAGNNDILVFSFIGYVTVETQVSGRNVIDVSLLEDAKNLDEVVVNAGYYSVGEREKTGSISKVSADAIEKQPVTNPLQAIQGRMPGIEITQYTGVPGSNFHVRIRGTNSLSNGNNPLYIIDGVPYISENIPVSAGQNLYGQRLERGESVLNGTSPMASINPNDIESIEVLKDADATAIYGSRGANGVILITTKRGKAGKVNLNVDAKFGASVVQNRVKMLNTPQYIAMRKQAVSNDGDTAPRADEYDINGTWDQTRYTDWQDKLIGGTAQMTDINTSISGGSSETQFLIGMGYNKQGVVFPGDNDADRFSTHFSVTHTTPDNRFNTRFSSNYSMANSNLLSRDLTYFALTLAPNAPELYTEDGGINWEESTWENPLARGGLNRYKSHTYNLITNAEVGYEIVTGLKIKSSFGLTDVRTDQSETYLSTSARPILNLTPADSRLTTSGSVVRSWIIEPQVNYETAWHNSKLNILLGGTYQSQDTEWDRVHYVGFPSNALVENPNAAIKTVSAFTGYAQYKYVALYGRFNYSWNDKYFVNLTGRRDGSSRFGPGRKFANLGAIGAAWIFSSEPFIRNNLLFLSFGKLRGSYGLTGNDQIGDYRYVDTYASTGQYQGVGTLQAKRLFNPDYGWEVNRKMEAALELGFFNDNILLTTAWYRNRSSNQLIDYQLAGTTGFGSVLLNSPAIVQNTGLEFEVNTTNISRGALTWTTSFNITFPKNKLIAFENLESSSYANVYVVGKPLTIRKVWHYLGVDPESGSYRVEDVNMDGQFTTEDQTRLIVYAQNYYGGLNNSLSYNSFQLDIFFQFVSRQGSVPVNQYLGGSFDYILGTGNIPVSALEGVRWQAAGDSASKQPFTRSETNGAWRISVSDLAAGQLYFIRLKNISISYSLPEKWLRGVRSRVYAQAQNFLTITNYKGLDPETGNSLPPLTTLVAGLQLTF